jgi:hypothetical protein
MNFSVCCLRFSREKLVGTNRSQNWCKSNFISSKLYFDDVRYWACCVKMIHNELVLLVCFSTVDDMNLLIWSNPIHYKKSNILITLLVYQYCKKNWKKITILEKKIIPVLCTILVYQYCKRQVQEIPVFFCTEIV